MRFQINWVIANYSRNSSNPESARVSVRKLVAKHLHCIFCEATSFNDQVNTCVMGLMVTSERLVRDWERTATAMSVEGAGRVLFQPTDQLTKNYLTCQNVISSLLRGPRVMYSCIWRENVITANKKRKLSYLEMILYCCVITFFVRIHPEAFHTLTGWTIISLVTM
jgi:hypothetical protein